MSHNSGAVTNLGKIFILEFEESFPNDDEGGVGGFDALPSSLIDSNVNPMWKQQKDKELGHTPWLVALWG